jgi:putative nucleotidyltransferase with HDIG domain
MVRDAGLDARLRYFGSSTEFLSKRMSGSANGRSTVTISTVRTAETTTPSPNNLPPARATGVIPALPASAHAAGRATGVVPALPSSATTTRSCTTATGPARVTKNVAVAETALIRIDHYADAIVTDTKALRRSLPDVAAEALALCTSSTTDANAMERTLSRDPFISAQVISIANSAMFAPRMPILGVRDAVVRIGLDAVRDVVLMVVTNSTMYRVRGFEARVDAIRRRTLASAAAARLLAKMLRVESEYGFLAGLLHDVGELVLLERCVQEGMLAPGSLEDPNDGPILRDRLDYHHTRVGGALCRAWKLPPGVIEAAEYHHDYRAPDGKSRFAAHLCAAADVIALRVMPGGQTIDVSGAPAIVELGITAEQANTIVNHVTAALPMLLAAAGAG